MWRRYASPAACRQGAGLRAIAGERKCVISGVGLAQKSSKVVRRGRPFNSVLQYQTLANTELRCGGRQVVAATQSRGEVAGPIDGQEIPVQRSGSLPNSASSGCTNILALAVTSSVRPF